VEHRVLRRTLLPTSRLAAPVDMRPIATACGVTLVILAIFMAPPMVADLIAGGPDWTVFFVSGIITLFCGVSLILVNRDHSTRRLTTRQGFMLTTMVWLVAAMFSSLPLALSNLELTLGDAFFEAMSGITTTGATVIVGLDTAPPGILLWRAILHWLGGIGIIVMGIAILPMLRIGGMQLFRTESSDQSDKILPRATQIATNIGAIYVLLTVICAIAFMFTGMRAFDAIAHAMSTIATGGFSTRDASIGSFDSAATEWVAVVFMILGGMPFVLYVQAMRGDRRPLFEDVQVRWFLAIIVLAAVILTLSQTLAVRQLDSLDVVIRNATFTIVSLMTTTGFASTNYGNWGPFAIVMLFFVMCVGGCTGSTTGGIKVFRFIVLYGTSRVQVLRLVQPSGVFRALYNHQPVPEAAATSVLAFIFLFGLSFVVLVMLLGAIGLDYLTAMSGAISALGNVGPGLGPIIGPAGHFGDLPEAAKWVLAFGMLLGRLELFTVLVLFTPLYWRG